MDQNTLNLAVAFKKRLDEVNQDLKQAESTEKRLCAKYFGDDNSLAAALKEYRFNNEGLIKTAVLNALRKEREEILAEIEKL